MNNVLRLANRTENFFGLYSLLHSNEASELPNFDDPDFSIENRSCPPLPAEHFGHRLLVKCLSLE